MSPKMMIRLCIQKGVKMVFDTSVWYFISFAIFVSLVAKPLKSFLTKAIEDKRADISRALSEAQALKAEAEALLKDARRQKAQADQEATDILAHAQKEVARLTEQSRLDIDAFVTHQKTHLEERIQNMEEAAIKAIHNHMIDVAVSTAHDVIQQTFTIDKDHQFVAHELKKSKHLA